MSGEIKVQQENGIAIVTISRPEKLNAVTYDMLRQFEEKVSRLLNDPNIFIVIFTGEGDKAFSAGFDIDTITTLEEKEYFNFFKLLEKTVGEIRDARNCITIAAVNGYAVGFGAIVSASCDFRFFSDNAAFKLPEIDLSIFPGSGAASGLLRLVTPSKAKEILLTGRMIPAVEAKELGIADKIFRQDELMKETLEFARTLAEKDRKILIRTKTLIDAMTGAELAEAADIESMFTEEWLREKLGEQVDGGRSAEQLHSRNTE
ncbi:MAG: enoyl-CoA hydratase/isomerase family protein [Candidatus Thorarchaeota archaeon]